MHKSSEFQDQGRTFYSFPHHAEVMAQMLFIDYFADNQNGQVSERSLLFLSCLRHSNVSQVSNNFLSINTRKQIPHFRNVLMVFQDDKLYVNNISSSSLVTNKIDSLYFSFNKQKYLYGLTFTLRQDKSALRKIRPDHVILPSHPYLPDLSLWLWDINVLPLIDCCSVLFIDQSTRKRVEHLTEEEFGQNFNELKWDLLAQHQLDQQMLLKALFEVKQQQPIAKEPNGIGYNLAPNFLNLVVSERGRSILFINCCDVIVLDPDEQIQELLNFYGIPLSALKAIILTNSDNLNWFQCLMKLPRIKIITEENIYLSVTRLLKTHFLWDEDMLKRKVRGKVLCEAQKQHSFGPFQFQFKKNKFQQIEWWQIVFGLKRLRIYSQKLAFFPSEVISASIQYLILYDIEESVKKELQKSPEVYRKKIIFNRVEHKLNNKYFVTLGQNSSLLTIQAHPSLENKLVKTNYHQFFKYKHKDVNGCLQVQALGHKQVFNGCKRVVYVRRGYVKDENGQLYSVGACLDGMKTIVGERSALVMFEAITNIYFYNGRAQSEKTITDTSESLLNKVEDNSFVASLSKQRPETSDQIKLTSFKKEKHVDSQWNTLNRICTAKSFEAGSEEIDCQRYIYIVVKGVLKWKSGEQLATKGMMIGNIKRFYSSSTFSEKDSIEVVKDTWAIQIPIKALHIQLFKFYPEKMYELFIKSTIFA